jgi:hypothetical protein
MGEEKIMYKLLVGKPEGKTPLGRLRYTWEKGIRMDSQRMESECTCK